MSTRSCAARRVKRSFIAQSGGTRLRSRHRLRIGGAWPAQDPPAPREGGPDRFPPARLRVQSVPAWRVRCDPGYREATAGQLPELFRAAWSQIKYTSWRAGMEGQSASDAF